MSDIQSLDSAASDRIVLYPHPDGSDKDGSMVQFPGFMSEKEFHECAAVAWQQLLAEHVKQNFPAEKGYGFIDTLVKHILQGKSDQARQYARAWKDGHDASA